MRCPVGAQSHRCHASPGVPPLGWYTCVAHQHALLARPRFARTTRMRRPGASQFVMLQPHVPVRQRIRQAPGGESSRSLQGSLSRTCNPWRLWTRAAHDHNSTLACSVPADRTTATRYQSRRTSDTSHRGNRNDRTARSRGPRATAGSIPGRATAGIRTRRRIETSGPSRAAVVQRFSHPIPCDLWIRLLHEKSLPRRHVQQRTA